MELCARIFTPVFDKRCSHCGKIKPNTDFYRNRSKSDGRSDRCKWCDYKYDQTLHRKEARRIYGAKYRRSDKGKARIRAWDRRYSKTDARRAYDNWYHKTDKYVAWMKEWRRTSPKWKLAKSGQDKRYREKHRERINELSLQRYYRIQDEASYHHAYINDWYPGFRLLKALENAEIVETGGQRCQIGRIIDRLIGRIPTKTIGVKR